MDFKRLLLSFLILVVAFLGIYFIFDSTTFWLASSTFLLVFLLGFQSLAVNNRKWMIAPIISYGIGACNLFMFKAVPGVDLNNVTHVIAYLSGGPFGILYSMYLHFKVLRTK